jgi:cyanate lyase
MNKPEMTAAILAAKKTKAVTWATIAQAEGLSPVFTTSACLGENTLDAPMNGKFPPYKKW